MPSRVIKTLQELVRINSVNPAYNEGQSEAAMVSAITEFFRGRGIETWEQEVFPGRPNLLARIAGKQPGKRIVFEAHTDTVTARDLKDPFNPIIQTGVCMGAAVATTKAAWQR